jgi:alpha-D-ribose 1-methylphosphonate 5-triphosphate diphosphatase
MTAELTIRRARVLLGDGSFAETDLCIRDGLIAAIADQTGSAGIDAEGLLLLPGIVDLHGDAFERQLTPRPGVHFPMDLALLETDRQMAANGITTAFHGLTCSWEPGLRSRQAAHDFLAALAAVRPKLGCDTHVHLRHEVYNVDAEADILAWLRDGRVRLLAFNDHLPFLQRKAAQPGKLATYADRAGLSLAAFADLLEQVGSRAEEVDPCIDRLAAAARGLGIPIASHDDDTAQRRRRFHALGAALCEFPLNRETVAEARGLGNAIILGAPNVVRGGSHTGGLAASQLVAEGLGDVLTSDYYYPSLLAAAFRLADSGACGLAAAWQLVSANPARHAGFTDRGEIAAGLRADLVLVDDRDGPPRVVMTLVAGRVAYAGLRCP